MFKLFSAFLFTAFISFCTSAAADNYLDTDLISPEFISPPLAANSREWKVEAEEIIKLQATIPAAELEAAHAEQDLIIENMGITEKTPITYALLDKAYDDCKSVYRNAKSYWKTFRPYQSDPRIKALIKRPLSSAYPSGHTTCSRLWAEILGQIAPLERAKFRESAQSIAQHRVITGMHWPHDLVGGEQLALLIFGAMQTSANYQSDLKSAQSEWR